MRQRNALGNKSDESTRRESGLANVFLQGVEVYNCGSCGDGGVIILHMDRIHRAIALALVEANPGRMTGQQLRFLRKHLELSGERLAAYLHTDRSKVSKWEAGEDPIGESADRLVRLLVGTLDDELRPSVLSIAQHISLITEEPGSKWELHVDVVTLTAAFHAVNRAA